MGKKAERGQPKQRGEDDCQARRPPRAVPSLTSTVHLIFFVLAVCFTRSDMRGAAAARKTRLDALQACR